MELPLELEALGDLPLEETGHHLTEYLVHLRNGRTNQEGGDPLDRDLEQVLDH